MSLRNLLFTVIDVASTPRVITLVVGAWGYACYTSLGQSPAVLYVEALSGPLDRLVGELDRLQVGATSTARLLGIAEVPPDRTPRDVRPDGRRLVGRDLRFAYRQDHDVLGIDLDLRIGEDWRSSVPPAPASPRSAGCCRDQPAAHRLGRRRRGGTGRPAAGGPPHRGAGHPGAPRLHRHGAGQRRARTRGLLTRRCGLPRGGRLGTGWSGCRAAWTPGSAPANSR